MSIDKVIELIQNMQLNLAGSTGMDIFFKWFIWYLVFFWVALVIWVARDAINRSNSLIFHVFSILLNVIVPVFWLIIYMLIRPTRTLLDKYYEDLEFQALSWSENREYCSKCHAVIEKNYKFCWACGTSLICKCASCNKEYLSKYKICPHCGEKKWKKVKKVEKKKVEK